MDEKKNDEQEIHIASIDDSETMEYVTIKPEELEETKETYQEQELPIASLKKVFKSDFDYKQKAMDLCISLGKWILSILLGIYHYYRDTVLYYIKNQKALSMIFRYSFKNHVGYILLDSLMIALLPIVIAFKIASKNSDLFKEVHLFSTIFKLGATTFLVALIAIILLGLFIPVIEYFTNKHHIGFLPVIKAINVQGITLNPYILLFLVIFFLGFSSKWIVMLACFILVYGVIVSYLLLAKAMNTYHLIRKDSTPLIMAITFVYSILTVGGAAVIYFTNSSLIQLIMKVLFK